MADDRHYVPGDFYRICDRTGFKIRANRTKKEWTGRIVRSQSFELRQPQDFVTGVRDDQTVPEPRPRPADVFIGMGGGSKFQVYGDRRATNGAQFLVTNQSGPNYNTGINSASNYTNSGTAQFSVFGGTVPPIIASSL